VSERDEQEIETRLRAAFLARSELVTHQKLRPAIPPNAHTAGASGVGRRRWGFNWRIALVPVSVAAALVGGVFVGTKLPDDRSGASHTTVFSGSGSGTFGTQAPSNGASAAASASRGGQVGQPDQATSPPAGLPSLTPNASQPSATREITFAGLALRPADWQLTAIDDSSACLLPKGHDALDKSSVLPCGIDALLIQTNASAADWPIATANAKDGWWPKAGAAPNATATAPTTTTVPCPAAKPSTAKNQNLVKSSASFRTDQAYPLAGTTTADFREWTVTCADGTGAVPRLWQIKGAKTVAITAVSVDARYDAALLQVVASMHPSAS
jgi:hypothetical protein